MKINKSFIYLTILSSLSIFFLWDVTLENPLKSIKIYYNFSLKYLILILLIPITIRLFQKKFSNFVESIFNKQNYIILLVLFIILHYFLINYFTDSTIENVELFRLILLSLLAIIYSHYRIFFKRYFPDMVLVFFIVFVFYSVIEKNTPYNVGSCNNEFFLIKIVNNIFNPSILNDTKEGLDRVNEAVIVYGESSERVRAGLGDTNRKEVATLNLGTARINEFHELTNSIYLENSHLAIVLVATLVAGVLSFLNSKKKSFLFIFLLMSSVIITLLNYSTTFFICYLISVIFIFIFLRKKLSLKFWVIIFSFFIFNLLIFFSDRNCSKKIYDLNLKHVAERELINEEMTHIECVKKGIERCTKSLTTLVYERGLIVSLDTMITHPLGWGFDGLDEANISTMTEYRVMKDIYRSSKVHKDPVIKILNLNDGLANTIKVFNEFGFFSLILVYFFFKYVLNLKKVNSYNIFIIILFITLSIRGAGYFNAGFIFCVLEFFYINKFIDQSKQSPSK